MNRAQTYLRDHGVKPSFQRIAIMEYLLDNKTHPTVETIYLDLCGDIPTLSKTTVYNTLKLFVESGVVNCVNIEEKNARFDADMTPHAHFRCKECGCIYDIPLPNANSIHVDGLGELAVDEVHLYYKGCCERCMKKKMIH